MSFITVLHVHVGFFLLDESILSGNVTFGSSICSTSQLSLTFPLQDSIEQWFRSPKKPGNILRCHETTSEEGVQKFYTDDMSLPRFGK